MNTIPTAKQMEFVGWEFGVFFHFGIRTFHEGHKDWDMKEMPLSEFNPTELDCKQWIDVVKKAGAKYAILVCKHHDGFANWPSKYTEYSVKNTPWKNGQGDIVKEFVNACRKNEIKVGLYYSPAQFGSNEMDTKDYDDYFINQISELLSNYGKIDYLWFDGCGSENHEYNSKRIIREIRKLQPKILIFNMWDPDTRWVGNEAGIASLNNFNIVSSVDFSVQTKNKDELVEKRFLPAECDCRIRLDNWFYSDSDENTLKSLNELIALYYYSVGRGANLLINIAPNRLGLLPEKDSQRIIEMGNEIERRFSNPLADIKNAIHCKDMYIVELDSFSFVNHVIIQEDISQGQNIKGFHINVYPYNFGDSVTVYCGMTIGNKVICSFPQVYTNKIEIQITDFIDCETIKDIRVFNVSY